MRDYEEDGYENVPTCICGWVFDSTTVKIVKAGGFVPSKWDDLPEEWGYEEWETCLCPECGKELEID